MDITRKRLKYLAITFCLIIFGLASRHFSDYLPIWIIIYLGDILWALMVFTIVGVILNKASTRHVALIALVFSFSIEVSQLYQAEWINQIRFTRLGGLVLGYGFLWNDIISYTIGVALGYLAEKIFF